MKTRTLIQAVLFATLAGSALSANAAVDHFHTIYATDFLAGGAGHVNAANTVATERFLGDINTKFTAKNGASVGNFGFKTVDGYTGVGVQGGASGNEIDIGQSINASFTNALTNKDAGIFITGFRLGALFDGPEFGDVNEKARITATYFDNSVHSFTFTAVGEKKGVWSALSPADSFMALSTSYKNVSEAELGEGGVWDITNPFGNNRIKGLSFTALTGACGVISSRCGCNNQSDYTLISISAVPEPETYAMMLVGLGLMGFAARRNKQA